MILVLAQTIGQIVCYVFYAQTNTAAGSRAEPEFLNI